MTGGAGDHARLVIPPPRPVWEPLVERALVEDLGLAGDLTTQAIVDPEQEGTARFVARESGSIAGSAFLGFIFGRLDERLRVDVSKADGRRVEPGDMIAAVDGSAAAILIGERTALNLLCHLSGIASATAKFVEAVRGTRAQIVCTRKTTPGLRALEKYAVRCGGGANHRFALDDAVLVKDNHIAWAGGVDEAVTRVRANVGHMVKVELEVDSLEQLELGLEMGVDAFLLDNMQLDELRQAVAMCSGRAATEASGGIDLTTVADVAATGVDMISVGWLTHSSPSLDIGLDV